jgi:hypothetical protein
MLDLKLNFDILKHKVDRMNDMSSKIFNYKINQIALKSERDVKLKHLLHSNRETKMNLNKVETTNIKQIPKRELRVTNNNFCIETPENLKISFNRSDDLSR